MFGNYLTETEDLQAVSKVQDKKSVMMIIKVLPSFYFSKHTIFF